MCGITGWIDSKVDVSGQNEIIEKMTATLTNRGPDAAGFWYSRQAGLGHRRLCVVDPAGGAQPMRGYHRGKLYVIVYNGELYNTPELRRRLELCGHTFRSHSDTEVLLAAYMEWGGNCLELLNGIYAFAVWDEEAKTLFMARDRMGVKPLFYAQRGTAFLFASEQKALLAHPLLKREIDAEGVAEILGLGPARTPGHGVFKGIRELRPGYYLQYRENRANIKQYWRLQSYPHEDTLSRTIEQVRYFVEDSITRQLVSDVPVCTFLSGGLDSSTIAAITAKIFQADGRGTLHTYSVDYVDNDLYFKANDFQPNADAPWVKQMTKFLGTEHHYIFVDTPQLAGALEDAVLARDLPGMADVDSSLLLFCREIKKEATVALSGECADEVFGGYPWFRREDALQSTTFPWSQSLQYRTSLLAPGLREKVQLAEYVAARYHDTILEVPRLCGEEPLEARRREIFYLTMVWFMQTLLDRKDRMSMATGLEVRVPFCDHRLVEYVWNIPWSIKSYGGMEKGLLRKALQGVLPEEVLERRKSPYPKTHNPAYAKLMHGLLLEIINDPAAPLLQLVDGAYLRSLLEDGGLNINQPWFGQLMTVPQLFAYLIQLNFWLQEYQVAIAV